MSREFLSCACLYALRKEMYVRRGVCVLDLSDYYQYTHLHRYIYFCIEEETLLSSKTSGESIHSEIRT